MSDKWRRGDVTETKTRTRPADPFYWVELRNEVGLVFGRIGDHHRERAVRHADMAAAAPELAEALAEILDGIRCRSLMSTSINKGIAALRKAGAGE